MSSQAADRERERKKKTVFNFKRPEEQEEKIHRGISSDLEEMCAVATESYRGRRRSGIPQEHHCLVHTGERE